MYLFFYTYTIKCKIKDLLKKYPSPNQNLQIGMALARINKTL